MDCRNNEWADFHCCFCYDIQCTCTFADFPMPIAFLNRACDVMCFCKNHVQAIRKRSNFRLRSAKLPDPLSVRHVRRRRQTAFDAYYRTKTASQTDFNGDSYYYETNQQGDVTVFYKITYNATTKALSATRVASYEYDAWGNVTYSTGTMAKINPLKYRGYYHDAESGFYYLQSRYYDPAIGRFVNADLPEYTALSATDIAESNLFTYCKNDPINRVDFDGNWSLPNWAKIAIGAAAIAIGVIATAATGGAAAPVLVASLKIAATSAAVGAVSGASISAVSHRVSTGSWKGAGEAAVNGAIDGAVDGFKCGRFVCWSNFYNCCC